MKTKLTTSLLLLVMLVAHEAHGQLRCYVCENCPDPFDGTAQQLQLCPADPDNPNPTPTGFPPPGSTTQLTPPPLPSTQVPGATTTATPSPTPTNGGETPPLPGTPVITPPPFPGRRKRQTPNPYRCYRIEHDNSVRRGCASYLNSDAETCQSVNGGVAPSACRVCDWEGCNSAAALRGSLVALLLATLLTALLKH